MLFKLSDVEVSILLGARLMFVGVPFNKTSKTILMPRQARIVDDVWERILHKRDVFRSHAFSDYELQVELFNCEIPIYIMILRSCLNECKGDPIELSLQLGVRSISEVETLINRLQNAVDISFRQT